MFFSARATFGSCWFQRQSKLAVHFSFKFRLLLPVSSHYSGDLSLEIANPVTPHTSFETHRRADQAVSAPSARPWYRTFVFDSGTLKVNLSTGEVFRRDLRIPHFRLKWKNSVFFPEIVVTSGFSACFPIVDHRVAPIPLTSCVHRSFHRNHTGSLHWNLGAKPWTWCGLGWMVKFVRRE